MMQKQCFTTYMNFYGFYHVICSVYLQERPELLQVIKSWYASIPYPWRGILLQTERQDSVIYRLEGERSL